MSIQHQFLAQAIELFRLKPRPDLLKSWGQGDFREITNRNTDSYVRNLVLGAIFLICPFVNLMFNSIVYFGKKRNSIV